MDLSSPVTDVKGIGVEVAKKLAILGVKTINDLIEYFPRRYDDYSNTQLISQIRPGTVTLKVVVKQTKGRYVKRGMHVTEAVVSDETGSTRLVWFNQPYRATSLKTGQEYFVSGEFGLKYQRLCIINPSVEPVGNFQINTARIVPIYKETKGLKSGQIRRAIYNVLPQIKQLPENLPGWLIEAETLLSRADALRQIHFPGSTEDLHSAKRRIGFDEVFSITLASLLNKRDLLKEHSVKIKFNKQTAIKFVASLPFNLTDDQRKVIWQVYKDLEKDQPMNRLIEGDVGSGKTVVATMSALMAIEQGYQVALMAPTELLARQHAETIFNLLKPLHLEHTVGLLVGSLTVAQKSNMHKRIKLGEVKFIIGTNALIQEKVDMHRLGLVIIDEQHRFGVDQRKKLQSKAGHMPHLLSMTATPIPRSLALTLYGELDISVISTKPANRKDIITKIINNSKKHEIYETINDELKSGRQAFAVCPIISESELMPVKSVEQLYDELSRGPFKQWRLALLHGKMKAEQKDGIMQDFVNKKIDLLVTTTVIEVGVDVPNATVMMIENSERFGLAQLHQLRGRVGRSNYQGYCYLFIGEEQVPSRRLKALEQTNDGFKLAEYDLELRGPGAIYGAVQHGQLDLRIAKLTDVRLISSARSRAQEFIGRDENLLQYKQLHEQVSRLRTVTNLN